MDTIIFIFSIVVVGIISFFVGWFFGKSSAHKPEELYAKIESSQSSILTSLNTQIAEMKTKIFEIEKMREEKEKDRKKLDEEKEKRFNDFIENTKKFFGEEKDIREKLEEKRDDQLKKISEVIEAFSRTIHGTATRGMAGEDILKEYLKNSIKSGLVETNLKTDSGEVEFAWNLGDGKFIPIDSKLPDVVDLLEILSKSNDVNEQKAIKKKISTKLKEEIERVRKYQNQSNTTDLCILAAPEGIIDAVPELVSYAGNLNVHLCSYKEVFLVGYILSEKYKILKDQGELGDYKRITETLLKLLDKIKSKTDTIDRAITIITNASDEIKTLTRESKKL